MLDRYNCQCRRDLPTYFDIATDAASYYTADNLIKRCYDRGVGAGSGITSGASTTLGLTPFQLPQFCRYFKILSVKHFQLGPGEVARFTLTWRRPVRIDSDYAGNYNDGLIYAAKKLGMMMLFSVHGAPANDTTTKTQVSSGGFAYDVVSTKRYSATYVTDYSAGVFGQNTLPTTFTVNQSSMNEDTGAVNTPFVSG